MCAKFHDFSNMFRPSKPQFILEEKNKQSNSKWRTNCVHTPHILWSLVCVWWCASPVYVAESDVCGLLQLLFFKHARIRIWDREKRTKALRDREDGHGQKKICCENSSVWKAFPTPVRMTRLQVSEKMNPVERGITSRTQRERCVRVWGANYAVTAFSMKALVSSMDDPQSVYKVNLLLISLSHPVVLKDSCHSPTLQSLPDGNYLH